MPRIGRAAVASALAGAVVVLAAGCGGMPTVVPAGSAGLEDAPESGSASASERVAVVGAARAPTAGAGVGPATRTTKPEPKAAARRAAKSAGGTAAPVAPAPAAAAAPAAGSEPTVSGQERAAGPVAAGVPRAPRTKAPTTGGTSTDRRLAALPAAGTYSYALTGTSTLGPPPRTSTLTVADAYGGAQLWTLDARREDGAGMVEELTISQDATGIHVSQYRLDASTGIAGVILEFLPTSPVLLTPAGGKVGTTWPFDLGTSADGCATARGFGEILDPGGAAATSTRRFRLTTTVHTVGPAHCVAMEGDRTQEIAHPAGEMLPTRIGSDLRGRVGGFPFTATTQATRSPGPAVGPTQSVPPAVVAARVPL